MSTVSFCFEGLRREAKSLRRSLSECWDGQWSRCMEWLDQVMYADTCGGESAKPYPNVAYEAPLGADRGYTINYFGHPSERKSGCSSSSSASTTMTLEDNRIFDFESEEEEE
eukprot:TRINITY_DN20544_c0_g1_i2.p1 TRINITY_DN20544_c0_g1~~TRINITY_DN20544_c0_g1_i2.p1  ORF type:complete len:112 (+),score=19.20 TRINITY_DN20544_c0_g1_i2:143-478(+)